MKIEQAIVDSFGHEMIAKGVVLDDFQIEYLRDHGVAVYINSGEAEDVAELERNLPNETKQLIEETREEDPSKVQLNEEVCKRVGEGIQYLFNNTDSENFMETTTNISNELVNAITSSNAVAIDINLIKVSDEYTFKHSVDVATMAMVIGQGLNLTQDELREIGIAGLLHDLGKSQIPLEILNKPGSLDDNEFKLMKQHSLFGFKILKEKNQLPEPIMMGVLQHHEKMNGKGYPLGTAGDSIHKYARIIAVADVYDALVTERPYKKAFHKREAVEMILAMTQELDMEAMLSFFNCVILFPVDSIVTLSSGEPAKVVKNNHNNCLRPTVVGLKTGRLYDLYNDINCANLVIL
ncbi:MAG: HD-GYP domain-containing protein [Lachnospiraceae bacterium]|nr:HD-GYP domain-containing protein [Lachnospiraceae bacterium]